MVAHSFPPTGDLADHFLCPPPRASIHRVGLRAPFGRETTTRMDSRPPAGKGAAYEMSYLVTGLDVAASTSDNATPPHALPSKGYVNAAAPAPAQGEQTFGSRSVSVIVLEQRPDRQKTG